MVKTAVIGASGFVGRHLCSAYRRHFPDTVGTTFTTSREDLTLFDLRQPALDLLRLEQTGHRAVLIASAKPNIEFCEREKEAAYAVNVRGTIELIRQISRTSMQAIFLSSDYVFEGLTGNYDDYHETNPTTEYGRHKVAVEKALPELTDNYLILRLSKMFGVVKGDRTLLDDIAGTLAGGAHIRAASDQFFCPTHIEDLTRAIDAIQDRGVRGVMNVCGPEPCSRYQVACAIAKALEIEPSRVENIHLHDIPSMAGRPLNTTMKCSRLAEEIGLHFHPLQSSIEQVARQWKAAMAR